MECYISGLGIISTLGKGIDNNISALLGPQPVLKKLKFINNDFYEVNAFTVDDNILKESLLLKKVRRADRFTKIAILSVNEALADYKTRSRSEIEASKTTAILSSSFGPHATTFKFLDGLLEFGEIGVSPTDFSHSVHNAALSYIVQLLNLKCRTLSVSNFLFPFHNSLLTAFSILCKTDVEQVILCFCDEITCILGAIFKNGFYRDNAAEMPILGEGGVTLILSKKRHENSYCSISIENEMPANLVGSSLFYDSGGVNFLEKNTCKDCKEYVDYSHYFGDMNILSVFHCVLGAYSLKNKLFSNKFENGGGEKAYIIAEACKTIVKLS